MLTLLDLIIKVNFGITMGNAIDESNLPQSTITDLWTGVYMENWFKA